MCSRYFGACLGMVSMSARVEKKKVDKIHDADNKNQFIRELNKLLAITL